MADISQLQGEIARDVSEKLRARSGGEAPARPVRTGTANAEAYRLYLQGEYEFNARTTESLKQSIDLFKQAIAADPNYAQAYAGLAATYSVVSSYGVGISAQEAHDLEELAARKAFALDDSLPEASAAMASALELILSGMSPSGNTGERLQLNPNNARAHYFLAFTVLLPLKRYDEALEEFRTALSLDPLSVESSMQIMR